MDKNIHKIEILADLIRLQNEETWLMQIAPRFAELYPHCVGSLQGYKKVFDYLKDKTSKKKKFKNPEKMEFQIKFIHEEFGKDIGKENYYHHVCGLKLKPNEKDIIETPTSPDANMTYCLSFSKLEEWLGFYVEYKTWINYSAIDIVCHCLYFSLSPPLVWLIPLRRTGRHCLSST